MRYEQARGLLLRSFAFCACIRGEKWDIFAPDDFLHINNIKDTMKKHNFKETLVVPRAMVPHANGEAARLGEAVLAQNVREQELSLQVTGVPAMVGAITPGERLLLMTGEHIVTANQTTVKIDGQPVATVEGAIKGAYLIGEVIVVVTSGGLIYLSQFEGEWTVLHPDDAVPSLAFSAATAVTRADVGAYSFAAPYSRWQAPLADADASGLERQLRAVWNALNADAVADGHHVGPMLVRWAVRLQDDTYLWMSNPVRVGDETLANANRIAAQVVSNSSGFTGTESTTLAMIHYSLTVDVTSGISSAWLPLVKNIDVFATDAARLLSSSRSLDYRCITRTEGEREYILEMGLSRLSPDAITRQLDSLPWRLVATAPATAALSGGDFAAPVEQLSLNSAQCATIGAMTRLDGVVSSTAASGRLYCCTSAGEVVVSAPGNAMAQSHSQIVAGATPLAMAVVTKPLYSGGFGRYPVYLFTDDGIFAILQRSTGTLGEARLVDRTVIAADVPPVEGGGDIWFVSRHRHLCRLQASRVTVCQRHVTYIAMAWCNAYNELWLLPSRGYPVAMMASGAMSERTIDAASLYSDPLYALAVSDTGSLLDLEREKAAEAPVKWHSHPIALSPLMSRKARRVVWHLSSAGADLTLRVTGQWGIMAIDRDVSIINVTGTIDQPLATAPILVPARTLRLQMSGMATTGTLLLPTLINEK